jgi:hypothetical protein
MKYDLHYLDYQWWKGCPQPGELEYLKETNLANIKVQFRREVNVDLNAYYPNFSKRLRGEIDEELFRLLGGAPQKKARGQPSGFCDTAILAVVKGKTPKPSSKTRLVMEQLRERLNGGKLGLYTFSGADLKKALADMTKTLDLKNLKHWPFNLIQGGFLEIVK